MFDPINEYDLRFIVYSIQYPIGTHSQTMPLLCAQLDRPIKPRILSKFLDDWGEAGHHRLLYIVEIPLG